MKRDRNTPGNHVGFNEMFRAMFAKSKTDEVEVRNPTLPEPSNKEIALGFSPEGDVVMMPAWARNTVIVGDEGRRRTGERILSEIVRIPKKNRELVIIDLKGGELARWAECANAYASDIVEADCALAYTWDRAERRAREWLGNLRYPDDLYDSAYHPWGFPDHKQTFVYVNDLTALYQPLYWHLSGEDEEYRKHVCWLIDVIAFRGRAVPMSIIAESSDVTKLEDKFTHKFIRSPEVENRIIGHANSPTVATRTLGYDVRESGYDPTQLVDDWMIACLVGVGVRLVRVPDDFDPDAVSSDPRYFVPEDARIPLEPLDGHGDPRDVCLWES